MRKKNLIFNITLTRNHHLTVSKRTLTSYFKNKYVPRSKRTPYLL